MQALDAVGQTYRSFLITKYLPLPELQSTLIELVHEPSGAKIMHIANGDPENLFCLSFQTLPDSSNGAAHILEHTVLCGSEKFPVKDPFFSMMRRSLNTFMNALTGQDFTCYPASSQVEKDFYNLLEVYLDAVFHPKLKKVSFLQEGHRLEWEDPKALRHQGVVFNEMKGAMTDVDSRLWKSITRHLLPNLPYAFDSGGDPKVIPTLTYSELLDFHKTFYHPSRCLFFFYGNIPLARHLDFIEQQILHGAEKLAPFPPLPLQPRFSSPIRAQDFYPAHAEETLEGKTKIAFCWLTAPAMHQSDLLALSLIDCILMETDASPLKMALLKSGACKEADSTLDSEFSEAPYCIICSGSDVAGEEKLKTVLFDTLRKISAEPIDPEFIEAALHQLEFQRTEISGEGGPFGLTLFLRAALGKQHGNEPENGLQIHQLFTELRDRLKDPDYLPGMIRKYLLENTHFLTQILRPDPQLEKKEQEEEKQYLEKIRLHLTPTQEQEISDQMEEMRKYQEETEKQSVECLPKITLHDIPLHARDFPLQHTSFEHFDVYTHECFTNRIIYADLLFDLPHIEAKALPLLALLSRLFTELGCGGKSYEDALAFCQAHTGGIEAHLALHVSALDPEVLMPAFSLRGKALERKAEPLFQILCEYAAGPDFTDRARIEEWLLQHATELEDDLPSHALQYAIQLSLSPYSTASFIYNAWNGLPYYQFVKSCVADKKGRWMNALTEMARKIVSTGKPHLILTCGKEAAKHLQEQKFYAVSSWKNASLSPHWTGDYEIPEVPSQARIISSPVAFTSLGMRTAAYRDPDVAELMLSTYLLENVVLHKEIREKGGAYGGRASYSPTTGNFHFYAYRDPHLANTVETFGKALEVIANKGFTDQDLEEAKIGLIGAMDTPVIPGGRAIVAYAWLRAGRTLEARQKLRNEILAARPEQVAQAVRQRLLGIPSTLVTFLGKELYEKEAEKLKIPLELLSLIK